MVRVPELASQLISDSAELQTRHKRNRMVLKERAKPEPIDAIRVGSVRTFLNAFDEETIEPDKVCFFRGHGDFNYDLVPSVYRNKGWIENEDVLFQELVLKCPSDFPNDECTFQKLVKMQHYSLPTRLLDLTANPLAALYFASSGETDSKKDGEVVFFRLRKSNVKYFDSDTVSVIANISRRPRSFTPPPKSETSDKPEALKEFNGHSEIQYLLHEIKKEKPYFEPKIDPRDLQVVVCVRPRLDNPRIIRQDGAFLLFGIQDTKTKCAKLPQDMLFRPKGKRLLVIANEKRKILGQLESLGITQATLFPEIDRVSLHIKHAYARSETTENR